MAIISIQESGLLFEPNAADYYFRLQGDRGFTPLSKFGVSEMDFGWYESQRKRCWLIELKDYSHSGNPLGLSDKNSREFLMYDLIQKAKDNLLVLASIWYSLPKKKQLESSLPSEFKSLPTHAQPLNLAFVLKVEDTMAFQTTAQSLQDSLRNKIQGQSELLGIRENTNVFLFDHLTAIEQGLPLRVDERSTAGSKQTKKGKRAKR